MDGYGLPATDRLARDDARAIRLLTRGQALSVRSEEFCTSSVALIARIRGHLTRSRGIVQAFRRRKPEMVRSLVRQKILSGRLPVHSVPVLQGGPGDGSTCAACGDPLKMTQLVMVLPGTDGAARPLHADCFVLWDQLRRSSR
jgi:hypothetical protein